MAQTEQFASLKESVLQRIRQDIVTCVLAPGEAIRDNDLAARYEVSTSPLREALVQLSIERLVEMPPNRPKRVSCLDLKSARDFFAIYKLVALAGFTWGAPNVGVGHLRRMSETHAALGPAIERGYRYEVARLLRAFFMPVYEAADNPDLLQTMVQRLNWMDRLIVVLGPHREPELPAALLHIIDRFHAGDFAGAIALHYELVHGLEGEIARLPFIDMSAVCRVARAPARALVPPMDTEAERPFVAP